MTWPVARYRNWFRAVSAPFYVPIFTLHILQIHGLKYFYTIGGWNLDFLGSVHRIQIDASTGEPASGATWEEVESLIDARADHACEVIQYVHDKNTVNNLVNPDENCK